MQKFWWLNAVFQLHFASFSLSPTRRRTTEFVLFLITKKKYKNKIIWEEASTIFFIVVHYSSNIVICALSLNLSQSFGFNNLFRRNHVFGKAICIYLCKLHTRRRTLQLSVPNMQILKDLINIKKCLQLQDKWGIAQPYLRASWALSWHWPICHNS